MKIAKRAAPEGVAESREIDIPFVDLAAQYQTLKPEIDAAIGAGARATALHRRTGNHRFEKAFGEFCRARHAVALSSGTSALELTLDALAVGPGDEVVTVAHTFIATVGAIVRAGATPVFVDVREDDWTMSPDAVAGAVTERTRAIVPVHLYGHPADVPSLTRAAPSIPVIEDAAQAHGACYHGRPVGSAATAACFSFYPTKNLGAYGDAGAVITNDDGLAATLRLLRDHGRGATRNDHRAVGANARMDELQAAVLRTKLRHLPSWIDARRALAARYNALLASALEKQDVSPGAEHVRAPVRGLLAGSRRRRSRAGQARHRHGPALPRPRPPTGGDAFPPLARRGPAGRHRRARLPVPFAAPVSRAPRRRGRSRRTDLVGVDEHRHGPGNFPGAKWDAMLSACGRLHCGEVARIDDESSRPSRRAGRPARRIARRESPAP